MTTTDVFPAAAPVAWMPTRPHAGSGAVRLALEDVSLRYKAFVALHHVSLEVVENEIVCLLGPSGSGKSTLLRLVAGVEQPSTGRIVMDGIVVAGDAAFVEPEQRRVGMVFQDYALFPHLTVRENVAFGLKGLPQPEVARRVDAMLARVSLGHHARSYPHTLSGGERQRVALARALVPEPRLLLMDEPFSSLDSRLRDRVRQETLRLLRDTATTVVIVTHDPGEAMRIADRIALLHEGRLVQIGQPVEVYTQPATVAAARFLSDVNELNGICRNGGVRTPLGTFAAQRLAEQAAVCVCIRPQHLRIVPAGAGIPAHVVSTAFLGEVDLVSVTIGGIAKPLSVHAPGRSRLMPGDTVYLEVDPQHVLVVPDEDDRRSSVEGDMS